MAASSSGRVLSCVRFGDGLGPDTARGEISDREGGEYSGLIAGGVGVWWDSKDLIGIADHLGVEVVTGPGGGT